MALSSELTIAERWSIFYNIHRRELYAPTSMEKDRDRLRTLREIWLKSLQEAPACSSDWPTTKTELDQLMLLLRWEPSKMWKIMKEAEITTSAQGTTVNKTMLYTIRNPEVPVTNSDEDIQGSSKRKLEKESHHTTTLRPSVFPFAYIRTFYNEIDVAGTTTDELRTFAYKQSVKQIDVFYRRAANYCKRLQEALLDCRNNLVASKLYDAFEKDHQLLANSLNREWIIAVIDKMRELGITVPEDAEGDSYENDQPTNLELAAELLEESIEMPSESISTESDTDLESISQASSSSTEKPGSVHATGNFDDRMSTQFESEAEARARRCRPHRSSNEPKQPKPVAARKHTYAEFASAAHRGAAVQVPNADKLQSSRLSGPDHSTTRSIHNEGSEIWHDQPEFSKSELGLKNKAYHRANHSGWNPSIHLDSTGWPGLGARRGAGSADSEIKNSTSLSNNEIHNLQRHIPNFMPQDFHMREPRSTTSHDYHPSGTPGVDNESVSNAVVRRLAYSKRSKPEKPSKSTSALDTVPDPNNLPSRQQRSHRPSSRSPNEPVPYADIIQPRKNLQEPGLSHEKVTGYPASKGQGQPFPFAGTPKHHGTQNIDWQALNQALERMIEKIYADDARNRAESYSRQMAGSNHNTTNVAADDSAEEEDASLVSSDESDLTDSEDLEEDLDRGYNSMENSSTSVDSMNID